MTNSPICLKEIHCVFLSDNPINKLLKRHQKRKKHVHVTCKQTYHKTTTQIALKMRI